MMNVVGWCASAILLLELFLVGLSALLGLQVWRERTHEVTGWRVNEPARWLVALFAVLAGVLIVLGFWASWAAVVGGILCAIAAGLVLVRRLVASVEGRGTGAYLLFLACGIGLVVSAG